MLEDFYQIIMVETVDQAKQQLGKEHINLVIIDISLPGEGDGFNLLQCLQTDFKNPPPAIAITAHAFPQDRDLALELGAVAFYTKPILGTALIEAVRTHIRA